MSLSDSIPQGQPEKPIDGGTNLSYRPEQPISRLARIIAQASRFTGDAHGLDNGERAALARLDPDGELRPHQIAALSRALIYAELEPDTWKPEKWQRWALIAHGMALAGHDAKQSLGQQLSQAGVSESRVTKLLTARGDAFRQLLPRLLRLIASKGVAPNWHELGGLILNQDRDEEKAEDIRLKIAGRFFSAEAKKPKHSRHDWRPTMSLPRFIQIHTLHTYPAALLNRDDAGLAKRLPLGNAVRTRISSQCLKRHWRVTDDQFALSKLDVPMAIRSRSTLEHISKRIQENGISKALAQAAAEALRDAGLLDKSGKNITGEDALKTGQAVLMGKAEIDHITKLCVDTVPLAIELKNNIAQCNDSPEQIYALLSGSSFLPAALNKKIEKDCVAKHADDLSKLFKKEVQKLSESDVIKSEIKFRLISEKENIEALKYGSGLESALFGRMVTSDILASREASVSVAHAFTVHQAQVENDYFTVVDDLMQEAGELGSAGIFDTELASGLYYGYVVVDVPQLIENLEGIAAKDCFADGTLAERRELAGRVVQHLLHLIATVSPGAKRGSTAPFDWAKFMLVEAGDWQPRSLAGAFHDALPLEDKANTGTIRQRAVMRLTQEISAMDEAYGAPLARRFLALDAIDVPGAERANLAQLGEWASEIVRQGVC